MKKILAVCAAALLALSGCTTFSVEGGCGSGTCDGARMTGTMLGNTLITQRADCSGGGCASETSSIGLFAGKVVTSNKARGCSGNAGQCPTSMARHTIKLTATGYGASSNFDGYTAGQRRLLAMRASKVDAYRALAEQIHGVRIRGNTTVGAMVAQHDSYRAYVDAYVRGARVISVTPMAEGNYETELELELPEGFADRMLTTTSCDGTGGCGGGSCGLKGAVGSGCAYNSGFYYVD